MMPPTPIAGSHWASADTQIQYLGHKLGGLDKLGDKVVGVVCG